MFGSHFRDFVSEDTTFSDIKDERLIKSWHGFEKSDSGDSGNCSETEEVENPVKKAALTSKIDNSLIESLIGNIGEGNKSFIIEGNEEESFVTVPKNLTIIEITNILNNAINGNNPEENDNNLKELDKIVNDIDNYGIISVVDLDSENFKNFCLQQLHLDLKERSDHQHIYSNILLPYKINQELKCDYSVKELVLLAIAANGKLTERYKEILFNQENSILLSSLVGGQRYIEIFTEKFHEIYTNLNLKEQIIEIPSCQVNFFSVIALRKEQAFLQAVLVEYALKDLAKVLQTSKPDPLYGVFETASLAQNEPFITMVLDIFEKRADDEIKKDLLARSIVNLLAAAISQEHVSIVEYLCQRYIQSAGRDTYSIYEQAFSDDKVISALKKQILQNIDARSRRKIYDLILKITLDSGNIGFIESLCKKCSGCSDDVINYLKQKLKNNELDNVYESILIALSNTGNKDIVTSVLAYMQIYQENGRNSEDVIRKVIRNILKNAIEEADEIVIGLLCDLSCSDQQTPAMQAIYKGEFDTALPIVEEQIEKTSQRFVKKPEAGWIVYDIVQMIPFYVKAGPEEVFADITFVEYCKITAIINTLYRIRGFLQSNTGIQRQANTQVVNATEVLVQEPQQDNNEFLVNSLTEGVMARNKKSGLNNKYAKGNNPTSWQGVSTESEKAKAKEPQVHNEELLNTQVESSADVSHAEHIDQEILDPVNDMAVTATNDQANASHAQSIDPEIVDLLSDMVEDVSDSQATLGDHEDSSSSERTDTNILVDDCSEDTALLEDISDEEDHVIEVTNNTHNDGGQPSDPNKNLQDAQKSKWHTVAISVFTVTAVASVAVAFYLEMLAVGIAVAAFCIIAAASVYCCGPSSELKDNNITEVAATKAPAVS